MSDFAHRPYVFFMIKVRDGKQMDEAKEELRGIVRKLRKVPPGAEDDFAINQQDILVQEFHKVGGIIASVGLFITGLSLFVGGIGIMNIMFVSVAERTREIGVRKAIGAVRRDIVTQFLTEAMTLSGIGGVIGVAVGLAIAAVVRKVSPLATSTPLWSIVVGLLVSISIGLFFGIYPAYQAARLDPVDALRYE